MKKQRIWGLVAAVAGIALLVGGAATASNMGFKFVPNLPGTPGAEVFNLSLPWNNNYTDAASVFDDIASYGPIAQVAKLGSDASLNGWQGPGSFTFNFPIVKGEAVVVFGAGSTVNPVIVGSHDPNFTFNFVAGLNNAAAPYHQTYTDAAGLFDAVAATCPGNISQVAKLGADASLNGWQGPGSFTFNFPLTLGEGVAIFATAPCNGFVWAHY